MTYLPKVHYLILCFFHSFLLLGCTSPRPVEETKHTTEKKPDAWFTDSTSEVGLKFVHDSGELGSYFMPKLTGGGMALLDFDKDGLLDVFLVQDGGPNSRSTNKLFRQTVDHRFEDVGPKSNLEFKGFCQGVAVGDVNNDSWPDILVTEYGGVHLWLNSGDGSFSDVTKPSGLDDPLWATSASFVDYDRDGWLDLVVVNYVQYSDDKACSPKGGERDFCGPAAFPGTVTKLFRNLGESNTATDRQVKFEDLTQRSGLASKSGPGLGILCADFDGDLWQDLFIANDGAPNHLWINQKDGSFAEEGIPSGIAYNAMGQAEANMGIAIGDVDGDQLFDLFVTHLHEESHRLWKQSPVGSFSERTAAMGLTASGSKSTGFGTLLGDFDNDGDIDLVIANGMVRRDTNVAPSTKVENFWVPYRQVNHLYSNEGSGKFQSRLSIDRDLCGVPGVWRGVACGDLDNDGGLDLVVTRLDGSASIFKNTATNRGNWMLINVLDNQRPAYGAIVTLVAGSKQWTRWLNPGQGFACSSDPRTHFGIGSIDRVDEIKVVWPDGSSEAFPGCVANQMVELQKGQGNPSNSHKD